MWRERSIESEIMSLKLISFSKTTIFDFARIFR